METLEFYRSFNSNKSIEELKYNISKAISKLENLQLELEFYTLLVEKPIYKKHMPNVFERLTEFRKELVQLDKTRKKVLQDLYKQARLIKNKIECQDMACDTFFIKTQDDMELQVVHFQNSLSDFKFKFFPYLKSVLINSD